MISATDRQLVASWLDRCRPRLCPALPAKEPPFDPADGGVPPDMVDGEPNADAWVAWKMLPSTVTEADVAEVERPLPGPFPPLFRAYLTARHTLGMQGIGLPDLPSDGPLLGLQAALDGWKCLWSAGYVAFLDNAEGDTGPLCFDLFRRRLDGDCPVVLFDHERLINVGEAGCGHRREVEPLGRRLYISFKSMMEDRCPR
jgi:hypothetical protein